MKMTLFEAIATGTKFKRKATADWFNLQPTGNNLSIDDLTAKDYYTEACPLIETLSMVELEKAYTTVNLTMKMGRAQFREFIHALCGMVVK